MFKPDNINIFSNSRRKAFTLAEVLITLGVIGVVAAFTIPTLLHNMQMKTLESKFKHTFSILNQAYAKTHIDTDESLACSSTNTQDCPTFHDVFEKNLKIDMICKNQPYKEGCLGNLKGINEATLDPKGAIDSEDLEHYPMLYTNILKNNSYAFTTQHGFTVAYYRRESRPGLMIDTNGVKGPNKWGYDLFYLTPISQDNKRLYCAPPINNFFEKGGKSCSDMQQKK